VPRRATAAGGDRTQAGGRTADPQRERSRRAGVVRPAPGREKLRQGLPRLPAATAAHAPDHRRAGLLPCRRRGGRSVRLRTRPRKRNAAVKLLAFELATEACSVALWVDGEVHERFEIAPRRHAELALPWADAVLAEAGIARSGLDAIAIGRGPGAFTGVRLAIAIGQGIALALDRPIVPVSTLAALAAG